MQKPFQKVGVLLGGCSSERPISLKSGQAVLKAISSLPLDVVAIDISTENKEIITRILKDAQIDIAFNALHGRFGEDGEIQGVLDELNIPYTGSGVKSSANCMDKSITQNILKNSGFLVPDFCVFDAEDEIDDELIFKRLGPSVVIKPVCEGSSLGVGIAHDKKDFQRAFEQAQKFGQKVLMEKFIRGREVTCGIVAEKCLPVIEIKPKSPFFDYTAKYQKGMTQYTVPAKLNSDQTKMIQESAINIFRTMACEDLARIDFILTEENQLYVLEVNTIPGFTETSLVPMAAKVAGIDFQQLCSLILNNAYAKKKETNHTAMVH
ncbi:MAG: D-alanine--D-alanine ligase [Candidatus Omnitrophica bacterium]|nr:D-alanine--D-alanine ligase [Candidatus Omnitrophota bacterium]